MYCSHCGTKVTDIARFCPQCGTALLQEARSTGTAIIGASHGVGTRTIHDKRLYAGFWRRAVAIVLDQFVVVVIVVIVTLTATIIRGVAFNESSAEAMGQVVALLFSLIYFPMMESSKKQATLGKLALGIKVTDLHGERISFWRAMGRYWAKVLSGLILGIGYLMAGLTSRKQALHDMIASTLVVQRDIHAEDLASYSESAKNGMSGWAIAAIVVSVSILPIGILAAIAIPAYQDYVVRAQVTEGLNAAGAAKTAVAKLYLEHGEVCESNDRCNVPHGSESQYVSDVTVGPGGSITVMFSSLDERVSGRTLVFIPSEGQDSDGKDSVVWDCKGGTLPAKYRPIACRP